MSALPEPPADDRHTLPLATFAPAHVWYRIHRCKHGPVHFGRQPGFRFSAPDGAFGTLYVAAQPEGAFVETLLRTDGSVPPIATATQLRSRTLSELSWRDELQLVDLTGPGLVTLGMDGRLCSDADYGLAQRWSRWFWRHRERPHGVLYRSRHDPSQLCAALYSDRVPATPHVTALRGTLLDTRHAALLGGILDRYRAAVI